MFVSLPFLIPFVFLVLVGLVVDTGIWFTHKRQLQNRADAARSQRESSTGGWAACGGRATDKARRATPSTLPPAITPAILTSPPVQHRSHGRRQTLTAPTSRINVEINSNVPGARSTPARVDDHAPGPRTQSRPSGPCDMHSRRSILNGRLLLRRRRRPRARPADVHGHVRGQPPSERGARTRRAPSRRRGQGFHPHRAAGAGHPTGPAPLLPVCGNGNPAPAPNCRRSGSSTRHTRPWGRDDPLGPRVRATAPPTGSG